MKSFVKGNVVKLRLLGGLMPGAMALAIIGCNLEPITAISFYPAGGTYDAGQVVQVTLPQDAKNVYLTTDTLDPVPDSRCAYSGTDLVINRPTQVKVTYDVANVTYHADQLYVIENNATDHRYANRNLVSVWERFFVKGVLRNLDIPTDRNSTLSHQDKEGGSVSVQTTILHRNLTGTPTSGEQRYVFDFYEDNDTDTGYSTLVKKGEIFGYRDEHDGFYTTLPANGRRGGGSRIEFAGSYQGWADADFILDKSGQPVSGSYTVYCKEADCAPIPVTYALGTHNQLVEIEPTHDENTHSCLNAMPE